MKRPSLRSFLGTGARLVRDQSGNTLALMAAAVIPLMGMIGGGLDMGRAYFAQSRLSQACDASALAGRRAMSNEDINTAKPEATKFFNFNFPQNYMDTASFTPTITHPDTGVVAVSASTTVPTTIMKIFNYTSIPISVSCNATQNFDNIDIVLVLDVTGSMADTVSGEQKIVGLRKAVMALYDELSSAQTQLTAQGLRLRYAIVPYSASVNVGKIVRAENASYIANNWTYQTRWQTGPGPTYAYGPRTLDVSSYVAGNTVDAASYVGGASNTLKWDGCIEERQTVNTITASTGTAVSNIPSGAYDLDIDRIPSSNAEKWGPQFEQVQFLRNVGPPPPQSQAYCPAEAKRLTSWTRSDMQNYVDNLTPVGSTYHDIGMIWGAHFLSRGGIFAGDNPSVYNDRPVNRYVIFMTDGILEPSSYITGPYGIEYLDRRIETGTPGTALSDGNGSDLEKRHTNRFLMACNQAKKGGASIWTIAFGLAAPAPLAACASNSDQVSTSANSADLIAKFKEIGKNIGALRLSQ